MGKSSLLVSQVYAISSVENLISILYADPENKFKEIIELIDKSRITELEDVMQYLHGLLAIKYPEYAKEFAKKYNIQIEEPKPMLKIPTNELFAKKDD